MYTRYHPLPPNVCTAGVVYKHWFLITALCEASFFLHLCVLWGCCSESEPQQTLEIRTRNGANGESGLLSGCLQGVNRRKNCWMLSCCEREFLIFWPLRPSLRAPHSSLHNSLRLLTATACYMHVNTLTGGFLPTRNNEWTPYMWWPPP